MLRHAQPTVSVCIPSYNSASLVSAAIESVLNQSMPDFELVVIDDASTDQTLNVIQRYRDPRIRILAHPANLGAEASWNHALSEAQGKYFKLLCHDDILYPDCLKRQLTAFAKTGPDVLMVSCSRDIIDPTGRKLLQRGFGRKGGILNGCAAIRKVVRAGSNLIGEPTAVLMKTDTAKSIGGFDGTYPYVIDLDFWCRILAHGNLAVINEPLCAFRVSTVSWSVRLAGTQSSQFSGFVDKLRANPAYKLSRADALIGKCSAKIMSLARQLFYLALLRR
jgi:glycosyltransferase involved in cell wall biosynthesis